MNGRSPVLRPSIMIAGICASVVFARAHFVCIEAVHRSNRQHAAHGAAQHRRQRDSFRQSLERVLIKFGIGPYRGFTTHADDEMVKRLTEGPSAPAHFIPTAAEMKAINKVGGVSTEITEWPEGYTSFVSVSQAGDGSDIELEIDLSDEDAHKAPELVRELRACGFIGSRSDEENS